MVKQGEVGLAGGAMHTNDDGDRDMKQQSPLRDTTGLTAVWIDQDAQQNEGIK